MVKTFLTGRPLHELTLPTRRKMRVCSCQSQSLANLSNTFSCLSSGAKLLLSMRWRTATATQVYIQHTLYKHWSTWTMSEAMCWVLKIKKKTKTSVYILNINLSNLSMAEMKRQSWRCGAPIFLQILRKPLQRTCLIQRYFFILIWIHGQ